MKLNRKTLEIIALTVLSSFEESQATPYTDPSKEPPRSDETTLILEFSKALLPGESQALERSRNLPAQRFVSLKSFVHNQDIAMAAGIDRFFITEVNRAQSLDDISRLARRLDPNVQFREPTSGSFTDHIPTDPHFSLQWPLHNIAQELPFVGSEFPVFDIDIDLPESKALTPAQEPASVIVGVIDSGVNSHPDLINHLLNGYNAYLQVDGQAQDLCNHGTHVAGIIGARQNNELGIAGINPEAYLLPVQVGNGDTCQVRDVEVSLGILWAVDHGAQVLNLSLGFWNHSSLLEAAINYALLSNVVVIASSGNAALERSLYPAAFEGVISVSAINNRGQLASFSNWGETIDLTAPGVDVFSTFSHNDYRAMSGTSMASPQVAGVASLIRSYNPRLTQQEVQTIMKLSARPLDGPHSTEFYGNGLVNAHRALVMGRSDIADYNMDGLSDFFDVQLFLSDFSQLKRTTDVNWDGQIDLEDALAFLDSL